MSLFAFLFLQAAATHAVPAVLPPSGKWQVEYAKSSCIISRAFGEKPDVTLFGLKPAPYSDYLTMLIIQPSPKGRGVAGDADIRLSSGFVPERSTYSSVTANGMRVTTISLQREALDALARGDSIAVKAGKWVDVALQPTGFDKALKALEDCEADLLVSWGFSREAQAAIAERPKGTLRGLFRADDYPASAIAQGAGGSVGIRLRIEADGKINECTVIESSGNVDLDRQTCGLAKKRARYAPAVGHDGTPRWSFVFGRVTWRIE